jgi:hypothetical protein
MRGNGWLIAFLIAFVGLWWLLFWNSPVWYWPALPRDRVGTAVALDD